MRDFKNSSVRANNNFSDDRDSGLMGLYAEYEVS